MTGLNGKPRPNTKFEVASISHCWNIKGEPQIFGADDHAHFVFQCDFYDGIGKPKLSTKIEVVASATVEILKENPKFSGVISA